MADPPLPGDRRRDGDGQRDRLGRPPGGRLHARGLPLPRRAGHPRRSSAATASHPAVIGFQVDNEPGLRLLHNPTSSSGSSTGCAAATGRSSASTEEWGLVYWSHRLSRWDDLWQPDGNVQPQYDLAWRRFQAELVTEFIGWQADIVREITGADAVRHHLHLLRQPGVDDVDLSARLDVAAGNAYYEMQDSAHDTRATCRRSTGPLGWVVRGPWAVSNLADLMYSSKQAPFLVTETNARLDRLLLDEPSPYDGQWRQMAWLLVARGARMVEYWHWHTLPFGAETYWGGVLPHSGVPGRAYREIARIGAELGRAGDAFADATPDYDVARALRLGQQVRPRHPGAGRAATGQFTSTPTPTGTSWRPSPAASSTPSGSSGWSAASSSHDVDPRRASPCSSSPPSTRRRMTTSTASRRTPGPGATWWSGRAPATATTRAGPAPNGHRLG